MREKASEEQSGSECSELLASRPRKTNHHSDDRWPRVNVNVCSASCERERKVETTQNKNHGRGAPRRGRRCRSARAAARVPPPRGTDGPGAHRHAPGLLHQGRARAERRRGAVPAAGVRSLLPPAGVCAAHHFGARSRGHHVGRDLRADSHASPQLRGEQQDPAAAGRGRHHVLRGLRHGLWRGLSRRGGLPLPPPDDPLPEEGEDPGAGDRRAGPRGGQARGWRRRRRGCGRRR